MQAIVPVKCILQGGGTKESLCSRGLQGEPHSVEQWTSDFRGAKSERQNSL